MGSSLKEMQQLGVKVFEKQEELYFSGFIIIAFYCNHCDVHLLHPQHLRDIRVAGITFCRCGWNLLPMSDCRLHRRILPRCNFRRLNCKNRCYGSVRCMWNRCCDWERCKCSGCYLKAASNFCFD
jgi:uncharacterized protein YjbI with pentapeptide repeats